MPVPRMTVTDRNATRIGVRYEPQLATVQPHVLEHVGIEALQLTKRRLAAEGLQDRSPQQPRQTHQC
jgi:hypothetical protein